MSLQTVATSILPKFSEWSMAGKYIFCWF